MITNIPITKSKDYSTILKILFGIIVIFAGAQVVIPIKPVSITLHTMVITLIGFTYSVRQSFTTVAFYIILGLIGLPMFSKFNSGFAYLMGPTGGYYIGMLIASILIPLVREKTPKSFVGYCLAGLVGHIAIYLLGVSWLTAFIGFEQAFYSGLVLFIPSGCIKILLLSTIMHYLRSIKK